MTKTSLTVLPKYYSHKRDPTTSKQSMDPQLDSFVLIHGNKKWSHDISLSPKKKKTTKQKHTNTNK